LNTYADTSFFVSLYLPDQHSLEAERRLVAEPMVWLTPLHVAEWTDAIEPHVFRGEISASEARLLHRRFRQHCDQGLWIQVSLPESACARSTELAVRYVRRFSLRILDTLHVASALELSAKNFWTFDDRQLKLARALGLRTR
jgi:predicted nucleic acid-binding protein